ncbi:hypothetical protein [Pseudorhodoferax sp. Leaf267]|uniref:hypothetical protein n=1 Tax=Pseudorhodoferax sp. Leaf267 TaxID=1736316 RepID=UPI0012E10A35|nr:hypothetical protein [Pseudorhodoferax sp. Leaf267]
MIAQHAAAHAEDLRLKQAAPHEPLAVAGVKLSKKTTAAVTESMRIVFKKIAACGSA